MYELIGVTSFVLKRRWRTFLRSDDAFASFVYFGICPAVLFWAWLCVELLVAG
jgi:hypothetical protein